MPTSAELIEILKDNGNKRTFTTPNRNLLIYYLKEG